MRKKAPSDLVVRRPLKRRRRPDAVWYAVQELERRVFLSSVAITANATTTDTFTVSNEFFSITELTAALDITFANDSALSAALTSPQGVTVPLFTNPAAEQNFTQTVFDQSAPQSIDQVAVPAFAGTFRLPNQQGVAQSSQGLYQFNGETPNGVWTLSVTNNLSNTGTINSFSVLPVDQDPLTNEYVVPLGQTTPIVVNGTDFGTTNNTVVRSFLISDTSSGLIVEGIDGSPNSFSILSPTASGNSTTASTSLLGVDPGDFLANAPDYPLSVGQSTTIQIAFTPKAVGLRTAEIKVTIPNGSITVPPGNNTFNAAPALPRVTIIAFDIQGVGLAEPNIAVNFFGPYGTATQTFVIANTGLSPLQLNSMPVLGDFTAYGNDLLSSPPFESFPPFSVLPNPSFADPIPPGGSIAFVAVFSQANANQALSLPKSGTATVTFGVSVIASSNDPQFPTLAVNNDGITVRESVTSSLVIVNGRPTIERFVNMEQGTVPIIDDGAGLLAGAAQPAAPLSFFVTETGVGQLSNGQFVHLGNVVAGSAAAAADIELVDSDAFDPLSVSLSYAPSSGFAATALDEPLALGQTAAFTISSSAMTPGAISGSITLTVADAAENSSQAFTLYIDGQVYSPPTSITSAASTTFAIGFNDSFAVTASGSPSPTFSEIGDLPDGVNFNNTSGLLSGMPINGDGASYPLTITADNGYAPPATQVFTLDLSQSPAFASAAAATFVTGATGMYSIVTTGIPTCTVTETGALPSGVSFISKGDGTALLVGMPAAGIGGTYRLTLTATNGSGAPATQNFVLTVDQPPTITSGVSQTFAVGTAGSFMVIAGGFPTPSLNEAGPLPTGVTFVAGANGTALLSGTPTLSAGGTYALTFTAANGVAPAATESFLLTVDGPPTITSPAQTVFAVGQTSEFTFTATGYPPPAYSQSGVLPTGVSFSDNHNGTGTLSGAPTATGTYHLTISATNSQGTAAPQIFTLIVAKPKSPAITSANHAAFVAGQTATFTITATGAPWATISESGSLPASLSFASMDNGTATITGDPVVTGVYHLTLLAANSIGTATPQLFTLTAERPPTIISGAGAIFTVGTLAGFGVSTSGSFPSAITITETGKLPGGVTLRTVNHTTALEGTPAAGKGGTYPIEIIASNGVSPAGNQKFMLTVNQLPAFTTTGQPTFTLGQAGSFNFSATGYPTPTLALVTSGTGLTLANDISGVATLSGMTQLSAGTHSLILSAANAAGTVDKTFTLTVDQAPGFTVSATSSTFYVGTMGTVNIGTIGYPTAKISRSGALPAGVHFDMFANGTAELTGTPGSNTGGTYTILLTASSSVKPSSLLSYTLTVDQTTQFTSANHTTFKHGQAGTFLVKTTGFPVATLSDQTAPIVGLSFVSNSNGTGELTSTTALAAGTYGIIFSAGAATQTFSLIVD